MDYRARANGLAFRTTCNVCGGEFAMEEAVWIDEDGGSGESGDRLTRRVEHHACYLAGFVREQEAYLHASNLAYVAGSPEAAAFIIQVMNERTAALTRSMQAAA
jgi:hypothetical protein